MTTDGPAVLPDRLERAIQAQKVALVSRVQQSGLYTHEIAEFDIAWQAYRNLHQQIPVEDDLGSLTTPESRNLVRRVALRGGVQAVVKVLGNTREPGEGEVLAGWHHSGLPCVEPISWGYQRVVVGESHATAAFLVTHFVPRSTDPGELPNSTDRIGDLTVWLAQFHRSNVRPSTVRTWIQRLAPHLAEVLPVIRRNELTEPAGWKRKLRWLSACGNAIVHGDPAPSNILDGCSGRILLDPPGAILAMREADIAQVCWHWGDKAEPWVGISTACDADPTLDPSAIAAFLGFNYLISAGYVLTSHAHLGRGTSSQSGEFGGDASSHLRVGAELIGELHIQR